MRTLEATEASGEYLRDYVAHEETDHLSFFPFVLDIHGLVQLPPAQSRDTD